MRAVAALEAVTYLALLAAVLAHRGFGGPDLISAFGPVHGVVFLVYAGLVLQVRDELRWSGQHTLAVVAAAVIPLGGFWVAERLTDPGRR